MVSSGLAQTSQRAKSPPPPPLRSDFSPLVCPTRLGHAEPRTPMSDGLGRYPDMRSPVVPAMPDTTSGGNAGMAGVGRRAFAAAAWSVRAGVALAAGSGHNFEADQDVQSSSPPGDSPPMPVPKPYQSLPSPRSAGPLMTTTGPNARSHRGPSQKEPVILPSAPLAERARHERTRSREGAMSRADEYHSASRADSRSASRNDARAGSRAEDYRSASRAGPSRSGSRAEEVRAASRAQLERSGSSQSSKSQDLRPFFDKYQALIGSKSDQTHGSIYSPRAESDNQSVTSAGEPSALPWAQSEPDEDDPFQRIEYNHRRYPTDGSIDSTASSHYGPSPDAGSSQDEMVMTPSPSWEGLSSVDPPAKSYFESPKLTNDTSLPISLAEIGEEEEEDEGDRIVWGTLNPMSANHLPRSSSASTVTPANAFRSPSLPARELDPPRIPQSMTPPRIPQSMTPPRIPQSMTPHRSRTEPPLSSSPPSSRPKRTCQKCGEAVGGLRRYVERDGIVLCEADWKKMYLPACRRCKLPIEKSAVSSSDGQLRGKWHRACFTCTRCDSPFECDDFYVHKGRPWCQYHYAEEAGTLCAASSCRKPIEGACILAPSPAGDQRFHPGHLRCDHRGGVSGAQSCRENMAEYYDVAGERFCERHVGEAIRRVANGAAPHRAEKRRTKLIDMSTGLAAIQPITR
ncbi:hypothetical protein CcaverHIS641_0100970 [Cutaneotrichosporon cavernicola]|nr:hypothetical protein CcaverHIS641_0100970 [Cutaneotrichosporon cavernicola]